MHSALLSKKELFLRNLKSRKYNLQSFVTNELTGCTQKKT